MQASARRPARASTRRSRFAPPAPACPARPSATPCWCCSATAGAGARSAHDAQLDHAAAGRDRRRRPTAGLRRCGRKIGPDPASIDAAMIGGIAANNASGMCCGTAQNSYHTLAGMRVVLADGTVLDTRDAASRAAFLAQQGRSRRARSTSSRARDARRRSARRAHPPQVPDQEHHRLQPECAGRFRRPDRHPRAPDDRLGRHARLHQRDHLPHRAGACRTRRAR